MIDIITANGNHLYFEYGGVDIVTNQNIYIAQNLLSKKFSMNNEIKSGKWEDMQLRKELKAYLDSVLPKSFRDQLKADEYGDYYSIPSVEELFDSKDDIFKDSRSYPYKRLEIESRALGEIYWLKNDIASYDGVFCSCCSQGGSDIQVVTNEVSVRLRILCTLQK